MAPVVLQSQVAGTVIALMLVMDGIASKFQYLERIQVQTIGLDDEGLCIAKS